MPGASDQPGGKRCLVGQQARDRPRDSGRRYGRPSQQPRMVRRPHLGTRSSVWSRGQDRPAASRASASADSVGHAGGSPAAAAVEDLGRPPGALSFELPNGMPIGGTGAGTVEGDAGSDLVGGKTLRLIDLFAGCGGLTAGFMRTGRYRPVGRWNRIMRPRRPMRRTSGRNTSTAGTSEREREPAEGGRRRRWAAVAGFFDARPAAGRRSAECAVAEVRRGPQPQRASGVCC